MIKLKRLVITLSLFVWSFISLASDTAIVFTNVSYAEVFDLAKKENKAVMLYFHYNGCGACLQMEKTVFKDKHVYEYLNSNFINFEVNTLKENGIEVNKVYKVKMHPTFLFFDSKGNELHKMVGVFSPAEFKDQAKSALLSSKNLSNYKRLYQSGNRQADFLFDYAYMLRDANELDSTVVNEYLSAIAVSDYSLEKNIRFIYEFSIHNFNVFLPYNNPRFKFLLSNKELFYQHFDSNQVRTRIVWILNSAIYKAIEEKDEATFKEALSAMKEYDNSEQYLFKEMDGRTTGVITAKNLVLSSMLMYYEKNGDRSNYSRTLEAYVSKIWNDADELNNYAWGIYEQARDNETEKIQTAIKCSARSIELKNNYANNDTYAWLLHKAGEKRKALEQAKKTIEIAKASNQGYDETQKLVDLMEGKR